MDTTTAVEIIANTYGPLAFRLLNDLVHAFEAEGFEITAAPYDFSDDSYKWSMMITVPGVADGRVDVTVEIAEEAQYDDPDGDGINFGLHVVCYGGRVVADIQPYNFTAECWVSATGPTAVAERWRELETEVDLAEEDLIAEIIEAVED